MASRVCDIKKKFEGLCEASKERNKIDSIPSKLNHDAKLGCPLRKNSELKNNTSCSFPVGARGIIKRSHAFRSDKGNRNQSSEDNAVSVYQAKFHNTKITSNNPNEVLKESHVIFLNKVLSSQDFNDANTPTNDNLNNDGNILFSKLGVKNEAQGKSNNVPNQCYRFPKAGGEPENKPLQITRPKSLHFINRDSKADHLDHRSFGKISKTLEQAPLNESVKYKQKEKHHHKTVNICFKKPNKKNNGTEVEDCTLSNTLKKVLKSPLPSGPPPKKPPRTFAHVSDGESSLSNGLQNEEVSSDDLALEIKKAGSSKPVIKPTRSKTESQIMLKKLEIALLNHNQGKVLEPKTERGQSSRDINGSTSTSEKSTGRILSAVCNSSLPDTPPNRPSTDSGCFGVLSCSNSMDLMKFSHIYDVPFEPKSQFYIEDFKEVRPSIKSNFISKENNIPEKRIIDYGKIKQSDVQEPIYAKPQTKALLNNLKCEVKSEVSSVSQIVKNKNLNRKLDSRQLNTGNSIEKFKAPVLHYMSSPILETITLLQSPAPLSPERSVATQKKLFESLSGRSSSLDFDNTNTKHSSGRSLSVDFSRSGDKDFHIDNEKIQMMVNEVYSKCLAMPQDSDSESVASTPDEGTFKPIPGKHSASPEEAQKERQQRTAERKTYLKRVCSRTKSFHRPSVGFPHLFEYLLLIGLDLNPARCKVPYIKAKYPEDASVPRGIEQLCFPDASDWPPQVCVDKSGIDSCYCIVITHSSGSRKYGYCRRVQPEGAPICLPLAYCIVSPYKANCYFGQVLADLESRHGQPEQILSSFIDELYQCPFPLPGQGLQVTNPNTEDKIEILQRKLDPRQEETDIARLLNLVRFSVFLQLFVTLLLERKVILLSYSISKLSTCIEGLCAALYPFHWQHTLVPIVPSTMLDLCQAPTPYVIGLLKPRDASSQSLVSFTNIDQVLVVDVDECRVLQSCGDESTVLPSRLCRGLREALHCAIPEKNAPLSPAHNLIASEALIALFVQLVGHYRDHIITSSSTGQREFQRDGFVKSVASNTVQSFLDWFSETTMFTAFIESRLDRSVDSSGLFEQRCVEHLAQQQAPFSKSYRANINKTVKSFGDRFKEWTNSS